jgi:hypothetical protein
MIDWIKNHPILTVWIGTFLIFVIGALSGGLESNPPPKQAKYCEYPGCIRPPSGFLNAGTGYCNQHAQQLRDERKILDKLRTQGY